MADRGSNPRRGGAHAHPGRRPHGRRRVAPAVPATEVGTEWTLENQRIARVNVTKNADLIEFYQTPLMARVPKIRERRAADMVERFSKQYQGTVPMRQGGGGIIFTF